MTREEHIRLAELYASRAGYAENQLYEGGLLAEEKGRLFEAIRTYSAIASAHAQIAAVMA